MIRVTCRFCDWQQSGASADPDGSASRLRTLLIEHVEIVHADQFPIEPPSEVGAFSFALRGQPKREVAI